MLDRPKLEQAQPEKIDEEALRLQAAEYTMLLKEYLFAEAFPEAKSIANLAISAYHKIPETKRNASDYNNLMTLHKDASRANLAIKNYILEAMHLESALDYHQKITEQFGKDQLADKHLGQSLRCQLQERYERHVRFYAKRAAKCGAHSVKQYDEEGNQHHAVLAQETYQAFAEFAHERATTMTSETSTAKQISPLEEALLSMQEIDYTPALCRIL
jgi:hypothetical protein